MGHLKALEWKMKAQARKSPDFIKCTHCYQVGAFGLHFWATLKTGPKNVLQAMRSPTLCCLGGVCRLHY